MGTNTNTDTPISALAAEYNFLPEHNIEKRIAQIVLSHISEIPRLTLEEISGLCDVSPSTFSRFCKHMGYSSYTAFKIKMSDALESYPYHSSSHRAISRSSESFIPAMAEMIQRDVQNFFKGFQKETYCQLVNEMKACSYIYFHDTVYSTVRLSLQCDLAVDKKIVTFSPNRAQQRRDVRTARPGSLFILIYDGHIRSREILESAQYLHSQKHIAKTALFSPTAQLPAAKYCDYFFELPQGGTALTDMLIHDLAYDYLSILYRETCRSL